MNILMNMYERTFPAFCSRPLSDALKIEPVSLRAVESVVTRCVKALDFGSIAADPAVCEHALTTRPTPQLKKHSEVVSAE